MKNKVLMTTLFFLGGIVGFALGNSITRVPKEILTAFRLGFLEEKIILYYGRTGSLPDNLDCLGLDQENLLDAWGNGFLYIREGETQCVFRSSRKIYMRGPVDSIVEKRVIIPTRNKLR